MLVLVHVPPSVRVSTMGRPGAARTYAAEWRGRVIRLAAEWRGRVIRLAAAEWVGGCGRVRVGEGLAVCGGR